MNRISLTPNPGTWIQSHPSLLTTVTETQPTGRSAWTPVENTYNHFLTIDLGGRQLIKRVATKGRSDTEEFVTEYILQYSDDGMQWRSYIEPSGDPQVLI